MNDESKIFNMSVRAFIALLLTFTVCTMSLLIFKIEPTLHDAFFLVLGFFFGQRTQQQMGNPNVNASDSTVTINPKKEENNEQNK